MKIAVLQMTSGIDPGANGDALVGAVGEAAAAGAIMVFTPEMSGLVDSDAKRAARSVTFEVDDKCLARVREAARTAGIWVNLGSLAVRHDGDARWSNRGFVINNTGEIVARYDKMHLFDVDLATGESWRESTRYVPGKDVALVETPLGTLGMAICYDMRFPALFQSLSDGGASVMSVPAAFTVPTGEAHWHVLLRSRAIENASFVIAAAQTGHHADGRDTYGHSLVIDPWGRVLLDMGDTPGLGFADLDLTILDEVRSRIPVLNHRRAIPVAQTP